MTENRTNIMLPQAIGMSSLMKRILVLCLVILPLSQTALLAQIINNNGAVISVSSISVVTGQHFQLSNGSSSLGNNGILNLSGNFLNFGSTSGNGIFRIGGNWNNQNIFSGSNSVIFNGSGDQLITGAGAQTFYNLSIENSGLTGTNFVSLSNDVTVSETLFMLTGIVNTTSNKLLLSKQSPSALNYTSGTGSRVLGKFERGMNLPGTYMFPLGTTSYYNPANLTMGSTATSSGRMLSEFLSSIPGNAGLPLADPPVEVDSTFIDGFWSFTSTGFSSGNYNINLDGTGFTEPVKDITRVVTRIDGGPWTVDGTHQDASGMVAFRDNLSGVVSSSVTQFALAKANPLITSQPVSLTVCEQTNPVFTITATGKATLTYRWFKDGVIITNSSDYTGNRTASLTINNVTEADTGTYYCVVRDRDGNTTTSDPATLAVNRIPRATATHSVKNNNECSSVPIDAIVLGVTSYGVPGTTFIWSRNNPAGITSAIPMTGTDKNIGDAFSGSFTNALPDSITITFIITPVGPNFISYAGSPSYTNCVGNSIKAKITVNPVPKVSVIPVISSICYDGTTSITLASDSRMTQDVIKFDYYITATAPPAIVSGNFVPASNVPYNSVIRNTYTNKSDTLQSVFFKITATAQGLCPSGVETPIEVKVHPLPLQHLLMPKPLTCEGGSDAILSAVLARGTGPYFVVWDGSRYHQEYTTSAPFTNATQVKQGQFSVQVMDLFGCKNSDTTVVSGARLDSWLYPIEKPGSIFNTTCPESADGELWVMETGNSTGTAPFKYSIVYNDTLTVVSDTLLTKNVWQEHYNLRSGNYKLYMTDANGCTNGDPYEIPIVAPDTIKIEFDKKVYPGGYNITCKNKNDGSVEVKTATGGNGGYTYKWSAAVGNLTVSTTTSLLDSVPAGKYYLRTTDRFLCIKLDSVTLTEPSGMQLAGSELSISHDGNTNISCFGGDDGYIKLNITGGSGNNTYSWISTNGYTGSDKDIFNLRSGNYTATVTDQTGCVLRLLPGSTFPSFNLTEPAQLNLTSTTSSSNDGAYNINCNGGRTGWINITVTGGSSGNYKYIWSTTDGSGIINGQKDQSSLTAGTYNLSVTDSNNCVISKVITLTQPAPIATQLLATNVTCWPAGFNNGSINLTASGGVAPYTYLWSNGAVTKDILNLTQGLYSVTVTYNGSCTKKDSVRINLPPPLNYTKSLSDYNGYNISCNGMANGSINVTTTSGVAPFIYTWAGPAGFTASTQNISNLKAGRYVLSIIDKNNCTATEIITLIEPEKLGMIFNLSESTAGGFNINCSGDNTGFIGIEPLNQVKSVDYLWADGIFGKTRMNLTAGSYTVIITDSNNCLASSTITLTEPDSIKLKFDITQPQCPDKPDGEIRLNVTGGVRGTEYTYLWSDNSTNPTISNILRGYYKVRVKDMNGCSIRDSVIIEPRNETCLIIPNAISANGDLINDEWNIKEKELYPEMEVIIFNRWGETVWRSEKGYARPWDGTSNGAPLPIDSYHYIIDLHNGSRPLIGNVTIVR